MWDFLEKGGQKGDPKALKSAVDTLITAARQKDAGQREAGKGVDWNTLDWVFLTIICEASALVLDERFDKVLELYKDE